jgi:hypothetical protein
MEAASRAMEHATRKMEEASRAASQLSEEPPRKRPHVSSEEERMPSHAIPNTHIKITSRSRSYQMLLSKIHVYQLLYIFDVNTCNSERLLRVTAWKFCGNL